MNATNQIKATSKRLVESGLISQETSDAHIESLDASNQSQWEKSKSNKFPPQAWQDTKQPA